MAEAAPLAVLVIEDSDADAKLVAHELRRAGHRVLLERVEDEAGMLAALAKRSWDVVLSDWSLPSFSGARALALMKQRGVDTPFIIVTGSAGEAVTVEAMRAGAHDYILKDRLARLAPAVERELREHAGRSARQRAEKALAESERQLQQAQKMEAIGLLAGGIAHDFSNLLSVIISYSRLALDELPVDHAVRSDLEAIHDAGVRSAELTRRLLAFGRTQALEPVRLDLNEIVAGIEKLLGRLLGSDIELRRECAPGLWPIRFDRVQLEQVIMNLAVNARDAMPNGGQLTIGTTNRELSAAAVQNVPGLTPGSHVVLSMADTGVGMDEATQQRAFEPFFTTKGPDRGTGLGLSTVLGIVRQSGGIVSLRSALGQGTCVEIILPRAELDAGLDIAGADPSSQPQGGHETILVVEDDDSVRQVTRVLLERQGYVVLAAMDGEEAIRLCQQNDLAVDLLLTDLIMPRMSGRDLAEQVRASRPAVAVLYMSGNTSTEVARDVLASGAPFMLKPITPEALHRHVRQALDGVRKPAAQR